jgi:hypothetical protein
MVTRFLSPTGTGPVGPAPVAVCGTAGPGVVHLVNGLARPGHVPGNTAGGFTLSLAKQALHGQMDDVIATVQHNVRLL